MLMLVMVNQPFLTTCRTAKDKELRYNQIDNGFEKSSVIRISLFEKAAAKNRKSHEIER